MAGQGRCNALLSLLLVCWICVERTSAATYIVGDSQGWNLGVNYGAWTASKTFRAGDVLIFTYSQLHSVVEVNQAAFSSCTITPINTYTSGNDSITLSSTKSVQYFICGTGGHCSQGMSLQINIAPAASAPVPVPAASPKPPTPTPATTTPVSSPAPGTSPTPSPELQTPTTEAPPSSEPIPSVEPPTSTTTPGAEAPAPTGSSRSSAVKVTGSLASALAALFMCLMAP